MLSEQTTVLIDHVAKSFIEATRKMRAELDQRVAEIEARNERRLAEIEAALIRDMRRQFRALKEERVGKAVATAAARRKPSGNGAAHP